MQTTLNTKANQLTARLIEAGKGYNRTKRTGQQSYKTKEWERVMRSWWMPRTWPDSSAYRTTGPSGE